MGAAESTANKLEDKRKSRITHRDAFLTAIDQWERQQKQGAGIGLGPPADAEAKSGVHVCVRKRPLFESEVQKGDYDTVTVQRGTQIVVHDGRMKPDMRNMFMRHTQFSFDHVFSEAADNDEVYAGTAQPLVDAAMAGKIATIFMFGQTGSGKTHTMSAVHERAAVDIFALVDSELDKGAEEVNVMVTYVELAGSACRDMLNKGAAVQLMTDAKGDVKLCGVAEQQVHDADDLVALITDASARRATCATGVHDQSSRSHGVCRITVQRPGAKSGVFTMVDLAGTERGKDSLWHDKELTKETAEINSSLMALKECVRERSRGSTHIPYRQSKLTQLLKSAFGKSAFTVVIATCSPSSGDTEHTLGTIAAVSLMDGQAGGADGGNTTTVDVVSEAQLLADRQRVEAAEADPKKWTPEQTQKWWSANAARSLKRAKKDASNPKKLMSNMAGKDLIRWPEQRFITELGDQKAGQLCYKALRAAMEQATKLREAATQERRGPLGPSAASNAPKAGPPGKKPLKAPKRLDSKVAKSPRELSTASPARRAASAKATPRKAAGLSPSKLPMRSPSAAEIRGAGSPPPSSPANGGNITPRRSNGSLGPARRVPTPKGVPSPFQVAKQRRPLKPSLDIEMVDDPCDIMA